MNNNDLNILDGYKNMIFLTEIGALIHDLGKLSEEFIKSKEKNSKVNFMHHLILKRLTKGKDPYIGKNNSEKDIVLYFLNNHDFKESFNSIDLNKVLNEIKKKLNENSKQKALKNNFWNEFAKIQGDLQKRKKNSDKKDIGKLFTEIRSPLKDNLKDQIKYENKISDTFISQNLKNYLNEDMKDIFKLEFLNNKKQLNNFADFIEMHHETWHFIRPYLIELLNASSGGVDGVDSEIDKGAVTELKIDKAFISSSFGYENNELDIQLLIRSKRSFNNVLENELKNIIYGKNQSNTIDKIINEFRKRIMKAAKENFSNTLGETRRAANDVTLWDHSYSVASLYKTALIGIISKKNDPNFKLPDPKQLKWKICSINVNGLDFWIKSDKIGDILARKNLLETCFNRIKELFETEIPLGNEIYRDENCISFLVFEDFDTKLKYNGKTIEVKIYDILNEKKKKDHESMEGELLPQIEVSDCSRGAVVLGEVITKIPVTNKV